MIEDVSPSISATASALDFTSLDGGNGIDIAREIPSRISSSSTTREGVVVVDAIDEDISSEVARDKISLLPPSPDPSPLFLLVEYVELASNDGSMLIVFLSNTPTLAG